MEWARAGDVVIIICSEGINTGSLVSWQLHQRVKEALGWSKSHDQQIDANTKQNGNSSSSCQQRDEKDVSSGPQSKKETVSKTKKKSRQKQKPVKEKDRSLADNVHLEFISSETNVVDLVQTIVQNHGSSGRGIRFILDEAKQEVTEKSQIDRLSRGLHHLRQIQELYLEIADHLGQAEGEKREKKEEEIQQSQAEAPEQEIQKDERLKAQNSPRQDHPVRVNKQKVRTDDTSITQHQSEDNGWEVQTKTTLPDQPKGIPPEQTKTISSDTAKETPSDKTKETLSDQRKGTSEDKRKGTPPDQSKRTPSDKTTKTQSDETNGLQPDQSEGTLPDRQTQGTPPSQTKGTSSDQTKRTHPNQTKGTPPNLTKVTPPDQTSGDLQVQQDKTLRAMDLFQTMEKRLGYMLHRLAQLKPKCGGPSLIQSEQWKELMATIPAVYDDVVTRHSRLRQQVVEGIEQEMVDTAWVEGMLPSS